MEQKQWDRFLQAHIHYTSIIQRHEQMAQSKISMDPYSFMELGRTVSLSSSVEAVIESSFQAVADYTTFTGYTRLGEEGGWFGFRHNPNKTCYGIFFTGTIGKGVLLLRRDTDGSWHAIKLWGGVLHSSIFNASRRLERMVGAWL